MKFILYSVGNTKHQPLAQLEADFVQRLERYGQVELRYVKDSKRLEEAVLQNDGYVIALDERGTQLSTRKFLAHIERVPHEEVLFVIGDIDGLPTAIIKQAQAVIALSAMTFTHELARVILLEQLYRVVTLQAGHPYHRD